MEDKQANNQTYKRRLEGANDEVPVSKRKCADRCLDHDAASPAVLEVQPLVPLATEDSQAKAQINALPHSVLLKIFAHLSLADLLCRASRVSWYWNALAHDPDLWRLINLSKRESVTDKVLLKLTALSDNVMEVDISETKLVTSAGINAMTKQCPKLLTLKLGRCLELRSEAFKAIGEHCHLLQELDLDCCFAVGDEDVRKVCQGCPQLQVLRLGQCTKVTNVGVKAIASSCPEMRTLILDQCKQVSDSSIIALVAGCPKLQTLSFRCCTLGTEGLFTLTKLENLEHLELGQVEAMTDSLAIDIARCCKQLRALNLSLCKSITDKTVEYLAKHCRLLQRLYLASCFITDRALFMLGSHCKTLTHLDVSWCRNITDRGVCKISETCSSLRYLGLTRCDLVLPQTTEELMLQYPHIVYSSAWLDCVRLLKRANREGFIKDCDMPSLAPPSRSVPPHLMLL